MRNFWIEMKALGRLIKFFGLMFVAMFAIQQYIWLLWVAFGK